MREKEKTLKELQNNANKLKEEENQALEQLNQLEKEKKFHKKH